MMCLKKASVIFITIVLKTAYASWPRLERVDYLEIGTSNFDTLLQSSISDDTVGLSIDIIKGYLDDLPTKLNRHKLNIGVGATSGAVSVYHIPEADIVKHRLPKWLKGCNSIEKPHPLIVEVLRPKNLEHLMAISEVEVITFSELVRRLHLRLIGYLKIDCETSTLDIVEAVIRACADDGVCPRFLSYEVFGAGLANRYYGPQVHVYQQRLVFIASNLTLLGYHTFGKSPKHGDPVYFRF